MSQSDLSGRAAHRGSSRAVRVLFLLAALAGVCMAPLPARSQSAVYGVGPGQTYANVGDVPWTTLQPGDTVQIYWRSTPYYEKVLFSGRGTATQPIRVVGVPGPSGQLPVLDGTNATTSSQFQYHYSTPALPAIAQQDRGLFIVSLNKSQPDGYKPGYLEIDNLEFRNAAVPANYTDNTGSTRPYTYNAAGVFVERGEHIVLNGCAIDGCGNGLFVASGGSEGVQSRDIVVEGCHIYGNGNPNRYLEHNIYTEAIGVVFQYNWLGRPRAGSLGNNLKDRSAGTVVRYNYIEGGAHLLDLVDPQDSAPQATVDPSFHTTVVYGNILVDQPGDAGYLIHYGGDDGVTQNYRGPTLYLYQNTFVIQRDQSEIWRTIVLNLETNGEVADVRNNIFFCGPWTAGATPTELCLLNQYGTASFPTTSWASPGWLMWRDGVTVYGTANGSGNLVTNSANDPGFVSLSPLDVHLRSGSACIDQGGPIATAVQGTYDVTQEYVAPQSVQARPVVGGIDLGAFESAGSVVFGNLQAKASSNTSISLTWTAPANFAQGFRVWRSTNGGANWTLLNGTWPQAPSGGSFSDTDSGLAAGTTYTYRVEAYSGTTRTFTSNVSVTTPAAPAAPSNLQAQAVTSTSIKLTWSVPASTATGFRLWRSTNGGTSWTLLNGTWPQAGSGGSFSYTNTGLTTGTTYTYQVEAYNSTQRVFSNLASATP